MFRWKNWLCFTFYRTILSHTVDGPNCALICTNLVGFVLSGFNLSCFHLFVIVLICGLLHCYWLMVDRNIIHLECCFLARARCNSIYFLFWSYLRSFSIWVANSMVECSPFKPNCLDMKVLTICISFLSTDCLLVFSRSLCKLANSM